MVSYPTATTLRRSCPSASARLSYHPMRPRRHADPVPHRCSTPPIQPHHYTMSVPPLRYTPASPYHSAAERPLQPDMLLQHTCPTVLPRNNHLTTPRYYATSTSSYCHLPHSTTLLHHTHLTHCPLHDVCPTPAATPRLSNSIASPRLPSPSS